MKYRKKTIVIDAEQYLEYGKLVKGMCNSWSCFVAGNDKPHVHTIHANQIVDLEIGDFVIPEMDGEHYFPCKPDIFAQTYEPLGSAEKDDKDHIYLAYVMYKLSDFKYLVYSSKSLEWDIKKKAPISIDAHRLFMDVIKKIKPELYDPKKTINEIVAGVEVYLFSKPQE